MSDTVASAESLTDLLDLHGTVALVTSAGQGVGATTAGLLAAQGAAVAVNDYFADRAQRVAEHITANSVAIGMNRTASEAGSWITGQTYPVNGGFSVTQ